jgi:6-phosphogluconolactonase
MILEFADIRQASKAAVEYIIEIARAAVMDKGFFTLVLSGGSTPKTMYAMLSEPVNTEQIAWLQTHVFWGDERWVAPTHPDSNYGLATKELLSKIPVPSENIHQIATGYTSPEIAAEIYEKNLRDFFYSKSQGEMVDSTAELFLPRFDLVLLGMGQDGHTASLFPGTGILEEKGKWVAAVTEATGIPRVRRITLTLPVLNQAQNILFLISGNRKKEMLNTITARPEESEKLYPAARIRPAGNLIWLVAKQP